MLTIGSICTGTGAMDKALEDEGFGPVVYQIENDPFCQKLLARHFPETQKLDDVRQARSLPYVDLVCAGFPCQDLSVAGKGRGLSGDRSGLWSEVRRIVEESRPAYVLIENVAAGKRRWLPYVRRDLHLLGYRTRAYQVSAADVGAPHLRRRVFVLADAVGVPLRHEPERLPPRRQGALQGPGQGEPLDARSSGRSPQSPAWPAPPEIPRVDDGLADRLDRERALGNAVVPAQVAVVARILRDLVMECAP